MGKPMDYQPNIRPTERKWQKLYDIDIKVRKTGSQLKNFIQYAIRPDFFI